LREELSGGGLPVRKAIHYALHVAQGFGWRSWERKSFIAISSRRTFRHQDGRVKILDFGLAKLRTPPRARARDRQRNVTTNRNRPGVSIDTTEPGMVLGTPATCRHEQVRGEPADHRADIFAFGCVLYEMLSGTRAFGVTHRSRA